MAAELRELKWGETPFDHMTADDVLLHAKRMYSALVALQSMAGQMRFGSELSPYWVSGVGGKAFEKGSQALAAVDAGYGEREPAYRTFYRYADDLLFDTSKHPMLGSNWWICEADGTMLGGQPDGSHAQTCINASCRKPLRPITWDDLKPEHDKR